MEDDCLLPVSNNNVNIINAAIKSRRKNFSSSSLLSFPSIREEDLYQPLTPGCFSPSVLSHGASFKERLIFGSTVAEENEEEDDENQDSNNLYPSLLTSSASATSLNICDDIDLHPTPKSPFFPNTNAKFKTKIQLHRSRTAPAMPNINEVIGTTGGLKESVEKELGTEKAESTSVSMGFLLLAIYLSLGVTVYTLGRDEFNTEETHPVVDGLYFSIVTMCTIGYGDITPRTGRAKVFSIVFVIVGFGFIDILLSGMVSYVLDLQESLLLSTVTARNSGDMHDAKSYLVDIKKGRMRIRMKVGIALGAVISCVGLGASVLHFVENYGWLDSLYLSIMSVTTVGYGDDTFNTTIGRLFASIWCLVSTLAVARAFLYLAEARIDKRHRKLAKIVLGKDLTVSEFLAADIDNNGSVRFVNIHSNMFILISFN